MPVPVNVLLARLAASPRWQRAGDNLRTVLALIVMGVYAADAANHYTSWSK